MNPHILNTSPDGSIVYVVNAGVHDREPNAHGETPDEMESASEEMEKKEADHEASSQTEHGGSSATMIGSLGNSLWAYEASNAEVVAKIQVGAGPKHPIPSPDGRWVYVTNTDDDSVSVALHTTIPWVEVEDDGDDAAPVGVKEQMEQYFKDNPFDFSGAEPLEPDAESVPSFVKFSTASNFI